jgi:hypothetical protein
MTSKGEKEKGRMNEWSDGTGKGACNGRTYVRPVHAHADEEEEEDEEGVEENL